MELWEEKTVWVEYLKWCQGKYDRGAKIIIHYNVLLIQPRHSSPCGTWLCDNEISLGRKIKTTGGETKEVVNEY